MKHTLLLALYVLVMAIIIYLAVTRPLIQAVFPPPTPNITYLHA